MTHIDRNTDPLFNLADALSEDIVAGAAGDPGADAVSVAAFDRIAARAAAQSRRRRIVDRLRTLLHALPAPVTWTSAMAGVAGIFVMGIAGGLYFHQQVDYRTAVAPTQVVAARGPASDEQNAAGNGSMSKADDRPPAIERSAGVDHAAAVQPAPAAAPPVAAAAPPPAPPAAAGVVEQPNRVRAVEVRPDTPVPQPSPAARSARRAVLPVSPAQDHVAALALAEEEKRFSAPAPAAPAAALVPAAPAARSNAPAGQSYAPATVAPSTRAANAAGAPPAFAWPVRGRVIAAFGASVAGAPNNGIDVAVAAGTDVRAADDGVVLYAGNEIKTLGNLLLVRHRDGFITAYAHAQSFAVKPGDTVRRGQVIAKSGQTGTASKPQLHFEIRKDSTPVDPAQYLPPPG